MKEKIDDWKDLFSGLWRIAVRCFALASLFLGAVDIFTYLFGSEYAGKTLGLFSTIYVVYYLRKYVSNRIERAKKNID